MLPEGALRRQLEGGRRLRVKAGFDPTSADLHLGHAVLLEKLRDFQRLGHEVCLIVGDFTARIGDPSGRNATRPPLDEGQIAANAQTYSVQAFKVLDPAATRVLFNSTWLGALSAADLIGIAARHSVARMLERDDFSRRHREGVAIGLHEFLYPVLQGYDSVVIEADVELGGTDQTFNLLVGRHLQESYGQAPQTVLTVPILEGTDGIQKMSKSLGNYIGLTEAPDVMFGKIMSISDELMWRYYALLGRRSEAELEALRAEVVAGANPRDLKHALARELVSRYHDEAAAAEAAQAFTRRFTQRELPAELPEIRVTAREEAGSLIGHLLVDTGLATSSSEALRLVRQNAVRVDGRRVSSSRQVLTPDASYVVEVGKRRIARTHLVAPSDRD